MRKWLFSSLISVASCGMFPVPAMADLRSVHDNGTLSAQDIGNLRADASKYPFDIGLNVGSYGSKSELENVAHNCVDRPNIVCIGIDPGHHAVQVRFGSATNVKSSDFEFIAAAGNSSFKNGRYVDGIESILDRARDSVRSNTVTAAPGVPTYVPIVVQPYSQTAIPSQSESHWFLWTLLITGAGCAAYFSWRVYRRQKRVESDMNRIGQEAEDAASRGSEEREWYTMAKSSFGKTPRYTSSGSYASPNATIINNNTSGGDNFALGYVLGQTNHNTTIVEKEVYAPTETKYTSDDSGGSGSSWSNNDYNSSSSSSSDSSSSDSGGSSSSWDSSSYDSSSSSTDSAGSSSWDSGSSSSYDSGSSSSWDSGSSFDSGSSGGGSDW